MFIELLLLQIIILLCISLFVFKCSLLEPAILFHISWLIPLIIVITGIFDYRDYLIPESYGIIALSNLAFFLGTLAGKIGHKRQTRKTGNPPKISLLYWHSRRWNRFLILVLFVYFITIIATLNEGVSLSNLVSTDLNQLRVAHWENYGKEVPGFLSLLKSISRSFVILAAFSFLYYKNKADKKKHLVLSSIALILLAMETLGTGGRILIAFVILAILYAYLFVRFGGNLKLSSLLTAHNFMRLAVASSIILILIYVFVIWFPGIRNPYLASNFNYYFGRSADIGLSPFGTKLVNTFGSQAYSALFGLSYFSNPISTLTLYYQRSDFTNWLYMGAFNFPIPSKIINLVQGNIYSWIDIRERLSFVPLSVGYASNPWATGIRDLLIDFGEIGTIGFMFLLGFISQLLFIDTFHKPSDINVILLALISSLLFVFAFFGFIHNGFFVYPSLIIIALIVIKKRIKFILP